MAGKSTLANELIQLSEDVKPLAHKQQGHKVKANESYAEQFVRWIEDSSYEPNELYGEPQRHRLLCQIALKPSHFGSNNQV